MMSLLRCLVALIMAAAMAGQILAGEVAGTILSVDGEATIRDDKARRMPARAGMTVEVGHMIKTRDNSVVWIELLDESVFTIARNSTLVLDEFLLEGQDRRSMTARMLRGAVQYLSKRGQFRKDEREIFLNNVSASIRGTNFIGLIDQRLQVVLISGVIDLSARSTYVRLDRRGQSVFLDRTGRFDEAVMLPDQDILALSGRLGWELELPALSSGRSATGGRPRGCAIIGTALVCD